MNGQQTWDHTEAQAMWLRSIITRCSFRVVTNWAVARHGERAEGDLPVSHSGYIPELFFLQTYTEPGGFTEYRGHISYHSVPRHCLCTEEHCFRGTNIRREDKTNHGRRGWGAHVGVGVTEALVVVEEGRKVVCLPLTAVRQLGCSSSRCILDQDL